MEPKQVYVFLVKRDQDREAWPAVYTNRELAESALGRVTAVAEVFFDENGNARGPGAHPAPGGGDSVHGIGGGGGASEPLNLGDQA